VYDVRLKEGGADWQALGRGSGHSIKISHNNSDALALDRSRFLLDEILRSLYGLSDRAGKNNVGLHEPKSVGGK
jgi:hypothetical protein